MAIFSAKAGSKLILGMVIPQKKQDAKSSPSLYFKFKIIAVHPHF
jgi:hypothetical protein